MAKIELITAPALKPVDVGDLQTHARIDCTSEEQFARDLIDEAIERAESYTRRRFISQTWKQYFDEFNDPLCLRYPPLIAVASDAVTYVDSNGDTQTLASTVWETGEVDGIGVVRLKYNQSWPSTRAHEDVVIVQYSCGYGTAATDVPAPIRKAIRTYAAYFFRHREGGEVPRAFYDDLLPYRIHQHVRLAT